MKIIVKIDGMMCGGCEKRMATALEKIDGVKSCVCSHERGEAELITCEDIDESLVKSTVEHVGYVYKGLEKQEEKKKGLFSFLKKK